MRNRWFGVLIIAGVPLVWGCSSPSSPGDGDNAGSEDPGGSAGSSKTAKGGGGGGGSNNKGGSGGGGATAQGGDSSGGGSSGREENSGGAGSSSTTGSSKTGGGSGKGGSPGSGGKTVGSGGKADGGVAPNAGGSNTGTDASVTAKGGSNTGADSGVIPEGPTVQLDKTRQTIQGFGINSAMMPSGKSFPIDKLFGTSGADAIGLSILRIGMDSKGALTGSFISEAKGAGAKIIGSCWSPPAECKTNGRTDQGGHLITDDGGTCYQKWTKMIVDFAKAQGLYAMSVGNESDFASCKSHGPPCTDDYDTTVYTAKEMAAWVKYVGPKLKEAGIKVIAPEASEWIHAWSNASATGSLVSGHPESSDPLKCGCYSNTPTTTGCAQTCLDGNGYDYGHWLWKDQEAWKAFDIFGVHEYDSQIAFAWPDDVNDGKRDKEVWQTEMSGVMYWPEQGPSTDINNGVVVAGWIHSALTVGEASAWLWWWYESYYQNDNEGLAIVQGSSATAKRYYTLGNYSKFMRPGYTVVEVAGNSKADVLLSAAKGDDGTVVVVAINKGKSALEVPIAITGGTAPASLTPNVTSASDSLKAGTAVTVTGGSFTASLPSMSVTTFVGK